MKNWPSRARCGPTTGPPLMTSQLVAMKTTSPVTIPCTTALRRRAWARTTSYRGLGVSAMAFRGLEIFEETPQRQAFGAALGDGQVEEDGGVPQEREGPAQHEPGEHSVAEAQHAAGPGDAIAR